MAKLLPQARILEVFHGRVRADEEAIHYLSLAEYLKHVASLKFTDEGVAFAPQTSQNSTPEELAQSMYFLGIGASDQVPYFVADFSPGTYAIVEDEYKSAREIGAYLGGADIEVALTAVALSNWHQAHPRCARCGEKTVMEQGGFVRVCKADQSQHHPRTDGAVIVLVRDHADRILLGHNPTWPEKRFSTFAGFVEPGETFEQCVAREVREEANLEVSQISYLGSQPWPFPASIMISFEAVTAEPEAAQPDGVEITAVRWFTRDELRQATESGEILLPPKIAVARRMIDRWYTEGASQNSHQPLRGGESWR